RALLELAGGIRRLPSAQDRGRGRAAPAADRAWSRLRAEAGAAMSFRRRMILLAAGAVAAAVVIASFVVYVVTRNELRGQVDASLRQKLTPGQPQSVQIQAVYATGSGRARGRTDTQGPLLSLTKLGAGLSVAAPTSAEGALVAPAPRGEA